MIYTMFYYIFFASAVLFYGIGINRVTILCDSVKSFAFTAVKMFGSILCSSALTWLLISQILVPLGLTELYPLFALLVFIAITSFIETIVRITAGTVTSEFSLSYLIILLALNESTNILDVLMISSCCFISIIILLPLLHSIKCRIDIIGNIELHGNKRSLLLISLAILVIGITVCNVSWLNPGVLP